MPDAAELLASYDDQLRDRVPDPPPQGVRVERDGPLRRFVGMQYGGFVGYRDLGGLDGPELDELIARQVRIFAERGERFEWKFHAHDKPDDLPERLRSAGFVPEEMETVVIAPVVEIAAETQIPEGVSLREVTERADFERIAAMEGEIWHDDHGWLADMLEGERAVDSDDLTVRCRRGRPGNRLCRLGSLRTRHGLRDTLGRRDATRLAQAGDLPRHRRLPCEPRRRARVPVRRSRRLRRQSSHP